MKTVYKVVNYRLESVIVTHPAYITRYVIGEWVTRKNMFCFRSLAYAKAFVTKMSPKYLIIYRAETPRIRMVKYAAKLFAKKYIDIFWSTRLKSKLPYAGHAPTGALLCDTIKLVELIETSL